MSHDSLRCVEDVHVLTRTKTYAMYGSDIIFIIQLERRRAWASAAGRMRWGTGPKVRNGSA